MQEEKFISRIYNYNPIQNTVLLHLDFADIEQQAILEELATNQTVFTWKITKPFRQNKQYFQLKYYFKMLKKILIFFDIIPDSKHMRALDEEIKKSLVRCEILEIDNKRIPVLPSKAQMSFEDMETLNKLVEERYEKYLG